MVRQAHHDFTLSMSKGHPHPMHYVECITVLNLTGFRAHPPPCYRQAGIKWGGKFDLGWLWTLNLEWSQNHYKISPFELSLLLYLAPLLCFLCNPIDHVSPKVGVG
jgi:hypothetical protein